MNICVDRLREELAVFADLGTGPPKVMSHNDRLLVRMFRNGEELDIEFPRHGAGKVIERSPDGDTLRSHASYRALLASEHFGDLRRWSHHQQRLLAGMPDIESLIPVTGRLSGAEPPMDNPIGIEGLDDHLASQTVCEQPFVRIMLIDGPAGIGKTKLIERLAFQRARGFLGTQRALVLHVQSRGRVLTFLQDLIAFSLQRLRLTVTFDQLPVLVRHGLVTLAIDGFDELADPNGYELAWGQMNELVGQVRGEGTLILAGRETFIGHERLKSNIRSLRNGDRVAALSLRSPSPDTAKRWLRDRGWSEKDLESSEELFEPGSYAMRPFFLAQIARPEIASTVRARAAGNPLAFLVELMIEREADKFGDAVDEVMSVEQRRHFVRDLLREVARNMADYQEEALDETFIAWLVDVIVPEDTADEILRVLKNRAAVVVFLENDDRPSHRRFAHAQLYNHFLGEAAIDAITREEIPKFIRRNILSADFLASFSDLVLHVTASRPERIRQLFHATSGWTRDYPHFDRCTTNLGALLVTMLPGMEDDGKLRISELSIDESLIQGTAPRAVLSDVHVSQLDIRGSDIRLLSFMNVAIATLMVDETTRVPHSCPIPDFLQIDGGGSERDEGLGTRQKIERWLGTHGRMEPSVCQSEDGLLPDALRDHDLVKLLERACRSRSYWIPMDAEDHVYGFARDPLWKEILGLLKEHDLVREKQQASSGKNSNFFHIRRASDILRKDPRDSQIFKFYGSLVAKIGASPHPDRSGRATLAQG